MRQVGFTLIELMIVLAIVGIISMTAIPMYQGYVAGSQVKRAFGEVSAYKSAFEERVARGAASITNNQLGYVVSNLTTGDSLIDIASVNADGSGQLEVTLGGEASPIVAGAIIRLERSAAGAWVCTIDPTASGAWQDRYLPKGCTH